MKLLRTRFTQSVSHDHAPLVAHPGTRATLFLALVLAAFLPAAARSAPAADQIVNNCSNDTELRNDLFAIVNGGGGTLTFACGAAIITLTGGVLPNIDANTVVDGGGLITLSGGNAYRIFTTGSGGSLTLKDITLTLGRAGGAGSAGDGGCIWNYGTLTLDGATIHHCSANQDGGAIYNYTNGSLYVNNSTLRHNTASRDCGALCDYGSLVSIAGSSILTNTANRNAGGVGSMGFVQISNSTVQANHAPGNGGGLFSNLYMALTNVNLRHNTAGICGGGVFVGAGTTAIYVSTIYSNTAQAFGNPCAVAPTLEMGGGGIATLGTLYVSDSTIESNVSSLYAGGLYVVNGAATLTRVTFARNEGQAGGGIFNAGGVLTATNTTFSANRGYSNGGGIEVAHSVNQAVALLTNVTLSGNQVGGGGVGGIENVDGTVRLLNTIVANSAQRNCYGTITNLGFNLSSDSSCGFGAGHDDVNPQLGPIGNHGGSTQTFVPTPGSPAVDVGTLIGCPLTDQRGYPRPVGASCDVGAVERQLGDFAHFLSLPAIRR